MPAKTLEAQVRHQPAVAIVDLHGEINAFAEDRLNAAYAEAESRAPDLILLNSPVTPCTWDLLCTSSSRARCL